MHADAHRFFNKEIMTLFELLVFIVNVWVGVSIAFPVAAKAMQHWGRVPGIACGVLAFLLGFGIAICFWLALGKLLSLWHIWRPLRPVCKNGKCKAEDYKIINVSAGSTVWICKCGDEYIRKGRTFMYINENGVFEPYMIYNGPFGRWYLDKMKK